MDSNIKYACSHSTRKRSCCNRTTGSYYRSVVLKTTFELLGGDARRLGESWAGTRCLSKDEKRKKEGVIRDIHLNGASWVNDSPLLTTARTPLFSRIQKFQVGERHSLVIVSLGEWDSFSKSRTMTDSDVENSLPPQWLSTTGNGNQNMQNVF